MPAKTTRTTKLISIQEAYRAIVRPTEKNRRRRKVYKNKDDIIRDQMMSLLLEHNGEMTQKAIESEVVCPPAAMRRILKKVAVPTIVWKLK